MGCCNYHIHLLFPSSTEKWLVRIPRLGLESLQTEIDVEYSYASEFATLKFPEGTKVPAPKAFAFDVASNKSNEIGVTYMIMEFLEGRPFNPYNASEEEKKRVYDGVADILIELSKHPLLKACSLMPSSMSQGKDTPVAGKIAGLRSKLSPPFGSFDATRDYYAAVIDVHQKLVMERKLYASLAVEARLTYSILNQTISKPSVQIPDSKESLKFEGREVREEGGKTSGVEAFYLTHIDAKGDHLLLSSSAHVTGIIDWQGARFVPTTKPLDLPYLHLTYMLYTPEGLE